MLYSSKSFSVTSTYFCSDCLYIYQPSDQTQTDFTSITSIKTSQTNNEIKEVDNSNSSDELHYYAIMNAGYGTWHDVLKADANTGIIGLAFGVQHNAKRLIALGAELDIQSGNTMRIDSRNAIEIIGVQPVFLTIKSYPSVLMTLSFYPTGKPFFISAKAGAAYLNGMVDNISIPNKTTILPETQIGFGIPIRNNINLLAYYQCLFGSDPVLTDFDLNQGTAVLDNLPMLQAGFLGVQIIF